MIDIIFLFILGSIVGSFVNALVYRIQNEEDFVFKRSRCPKCGHKLSSWELIPIFSFLFLKGRCKECNKKISLQYPFIEIISGVLFVIPFLYASFDLYLFFYYPLIFLLIVIFAYDLKYYLIPDIFTYSAILIGFGFNFFKDFKLGNEILSWSSISVQSFLCGLAIATFFFLLVFISKEGWMGKGDIGLGFLLGLLLGWPKAVIGFFLAFAIGSIVGVLLILLKEKGMKTKVPFGPFLVTGIIVAMFWGDQIFNWYINLILF